MTTGPAPITGKDWQNHAEPRIMAEDLRALEQGIQQALDGGGGGTGSGIELVSGTVTLDGSGAPIREFYCTGTATIGGISFPAGTAVVWRRTMAGQWGYIVVDGWTDPELITVTATAPSWADDTTSGGGYWSTPTIAGVTYSPASGTATPGQTVTVTATAQTGYQLTGTTTWSHTFPTAAGPDPIEVTATAPTWTDDTVNGGGTWTTPTITGVTYSPASGTATAGQSVTVTATANSGYTLTGTTSWTHTFPAEPVVGTIVLEDTFDRADGDLIGTSVDTGSAVWAVDPANAMLVGNSPASLLIDAGAAVNPVSTNCAALISFTPPAAFEASIDMVTSSSKNFRAALFGYMFNVKNSSIQVYTPAISSIGTTENTGGTVRKIRLVWDGTTASLYADESLIGTSTDAPTDLIGISVSSSALVARADNLKVVAP